MFPQEGTGSSEAMTTSMSHVETAQPAPAYAALPAPPAPAPAPAPAAPQLTYSAPGPPAPSPFDAPPPAAAAWAVTPADKSRYDEIFASLSPQNGFVSGMGVRPILERSGLPVDTLRQVWNLSDIDRDGQLDSDEFAVATPVGTCPACPV
jgi:hypothetical protein